MEAQCAQPDPATAGIGFHLRNLLHFSRPVKARRSVSTSCLPYICTPQGFHVCSRENRVMTKVAPMKATLCFGAIALAQILGCWIVVGAGNWSQFRGPDGQGVSPSKEVPLTWSAEKNLRWKAALPGPGGSSPVVFGERIWLTSYTGYGVPGETGGDMSQLKRHLICLNRADGKPLWTNPVDAVLPEQPKVRDHGYASSTPAVDAERVYVFFGKSGVLAFGHDGRKLWHADVGSKVHGWGSAT